VLPEYSRMLVILAGYLEVKKCYRIEIYQEEIFLLLPMVIQLKFSEQKLEKVFYQIY